MPSKKWLGNRTAILDSGLTWTTIAPQTASPPLQLDRWFRNGQHPDAAVISAMGEAVNQAVLYRPKEVFGMIGRLGAPAGIGVTSFGTGDRARWRFAFHTGKWHHTLWCRVVMYPQTSGFNYDSYARLDIATNTAGTPAVLSQQFHYGANPLNSFSVSGWQYLKIVDKFVTGLDPDTDYYGTFYDVDYGLIQSACIVDLQSLSEHNNGYLPSNFTSESQILDVYRENIVTKLEPLWKTNGAKVLNWTVDNGTSPRTRTSATPINILDNSNTTISAATPGYTLDMTGKARLSQSGVPCVMKAFGSMAAGTNGNVYLKDSAGNTVASITAAWTTTPSWQSVAFDMPLGVDKYDLQFSTGASTFSLYAVSIYEYEV